MCVIGGSENRPEEEEKDFKNYGQTFFKFDKNYKPTKPNSMKPKSKKHEQTYTKAWNSQVVQNQW